MIASSNILVAIRNNSSNMLIYYEVIAAQERSKRAALEAQDAKEPLRLSITLDDLATDILVTSMRYYYH